VCGRAYTGATLTKTTGANRVLICVVAGGTNSGASDAVYLTVDIDGTNELGTIGLSEGCNTCNSYANMSFTYMTAALTAASHTFKLQMRASGSTATIRASSSLANVFGVMEISD